MKSIYRTIFGGLLLLLALASCTGKDIPMTEPEGSKEMIQWSVQSDTAVFSKALMDDATLKAACTPREDGYESIGIWGTYDLEEDGQISTYVEFDAEPLVYLAKASEITNPYNDWNYLSEARYWAYGGKYKFRACYPQKLMASLINTRMDATEFQGGPINTSVVQEDIMVAATTVDKSQNVSGPVELKMQHVFAAVMFKVRKVTEDFELPTGEGVTSCWLENKTNATDLFSPSGYLVHTGNETPEINWYTYESSTAPMYVWKHSGLSFETENTLYTSNGGLEGTEYTRNDGWLLVVPQTVKAETLKFCYTLKSTGSKVFSTGIPAVTYEPGKRYTYALIIRGSDVDLTLTVTPWNYKDSSHDIVM